MFPTSLSPSRSSDFLQCPLLYRFRTIDQLQEEPSVAAIRGTLVHKVLENLFGIPSGERTVSAAQELFHQALAQLRAENPAEFAAVVGEEVVGEEISRYVNKAIEPVVPILDTYFAMEDPNRLEPFARELPLIAELKPDFHIKGFIDRVDKSPQGAIRVVDYKTGKSPGDRFTDKAMFQMRFYALAWWKITQDVPHTLQIMYLGDGKFLKYQPDVDDLLATEKRILAIRTAIEQAADLGKFNPSPSKLCNWCSFKQLCPAFGGAVPNLPDRSLWTSGSSLVENALASALKVSDERP
jgi:putative RecB family exonuclease